MDKNKIKVLIIVLVVILVAVLVYVKKGDQFSDSYSVVYLTTGEVYIGKLTNLRDLELKDAYILQVTKDPIDETKNNFNLQPIKDALWAPKMLHLVKDNVVFYGPLSSSSKIAETLAEQVK